MKDELADAFRVVRDTTVNNHKLSNAEALAVLELIAHEQKNKMHNEIRNAAMNVGG